MEWEQRYGHAGTQILVCCARDQLFPISGRRLVSVYYCSASIHFASEGFVWLSILANVSTSLLTRGMKELCKMKKGRCYMDEATGFQAVS